MINHGNFIRNANFREAHQFRLFSLLPFVGIIEIRPFSGFVVLNSLLMVIHPKHD